jgi:hypothetical protein
MSKCDFIKIFFFINLFVSYNLSHRFNMLIKVFRLLFPIDFFLISSLNIRLVEN